MTVAHALEVLALRCDDSEDVKQALTEIRDALTKDTPESPAAMQGGAELTKAVVKAPRSRAWWDKHTVIRRVVTHLNEYGARVLFALPGRGIYLVAETSEQAERHLAYARERWPEEVYEVCEARFWRAANGWPGDPVHTLIEP